MKIRATFGKQPIVLSGGNNSYVNLSLKNPANIPKTTALAEAEIKNAIANLGDSTVKITWTTPYDPNVASSYVARITITNKYGNESLRYNLSIRINS